MPDFFEKIFNSLIKRLQHQYLIFSSFVVIVFLAVIYFLLSQAVVNYFVVMLVVATIVFVLIICGVAYYRYDVHGLGIQPSFMIKSAIKRDRSTYAEIYNDGEEDIVEFEAKIYWQQQGTSQERVILEFINVDDDPLFQPFENINVLKVRADKIFRLPDRSTDGKIQVVISGVGQRTKKKINRKDYINVKSE